MPIKGVSEIVRLPRLGKVRLGVKEDGVEGSAYPSPTDYFLCPDQVKKVFGERPKELRIMFPTEDESQWAGQHLKCYSESGRLVCRGDGAKAVACVDARSGEIALGETDETRLREVSCAPDACLHYARRQCRRVMSLQFLLPECPGFGVYQLDTSSYHSIVSVNSMLELVRSTCQRVSMLPLTLRLAPREVDVDGESKVVHVLELGATGSLLEMQEYARIPRGQAMLVPPPDSEAPDDLFPHTASRPAEPMDGVSRAGNERLELWHRARSLIEELEICDAQVRSWFRSEYQCQVGLGDFTGEALPERLSTEQLRRFCDAVERHGYRG